VLVFVLLLLFVAVVVVVIVVVVVVVVVVILSLFGLARQPLTQTLAALGAAGTRTPLFLFSLRHTPLCSFATLVRAHRRRRKRDG
jgi:hypothetical protein